jgi:hypothetical protein
MTLYDLGLCMSLAVAYSMIHRFICITMYTMQKNLKNLPYDIR